MNPYANEHKPLVSIVSLGNGAVNGKQIGMPETEETREKAFDEKQKYPAKTCQTDLYLVQYTRFWLPLRAGQTWEGWQ